MESDQEQFYDSLDEDIFTSTGSRAKDDYAEENSVPLYNREIPRSDVSSNKNSKVLRANKDKKSDRNHIIALTNQNANGDIFGPDLEPKSRNSYLTMFRTRSKKVSKTGLETDRATNGDETERVSFSTGFTEGSENVCNYEECDANQNYDLDQSAQEIEFSQVSLITDISGVSQLKSVSQQQLVPSNHRQTKTQIVSPVIGGLGPDIDREKLKQLQKKLDYGMKATEKNRIKFMEKKVLQNLKREIESCRKNRKNELTRTTTKKTEGTKCPPTPSSS